MSAVHAYGEALVSKRVPYGVEKHVAACDSMDVQSHSHAVCDAVQSWRGSGEGSAGAESPTCRSSGLLVALGSAPHPAAFPECSERARQGGHGTSQPLRAVRMTVIISDNLLQELSTL